LLTSINNANIALAREVAHQLSSGVVFVGVRSNSQSILIEFDFVS